MLGKLLSKEECAGCRLCCSFESYGLLETPVITPDTAQLIRRDHLPEQRFFDHDGRCIMVMQPEPGSDIHYCPLLDHERGCVMGERKPFECRIFPFIVMRREGRLLIALSPLCPVISKKPAAAIREKCAGLADEIFKEAEACPGLVKPYSPGCTVLFEKV